MTIDRREFMAAAAAGLGSQLVSRSGDALAQTAARPLPPDNGLFPGFEARWVHTNGADIFLRHGGISFSGMAARASRCCSMATRNRTSAGIRSPAPSPGDITSS